MFMFWGHVERFASLIFGRLRRLGVMRAMGVMVACLLAGVTLLGANLQASTDLAAKRQATSPRVTQPPTIDGRLDDAAWKQASVLTNFLSMDRLKRTVSEQTIVRLCADADNLYLAFICQTQAIDKIVANHGSDSLDARRLYKDDVVEVFIDPQQTGDDYYHYMVNARGAIFDLEAHRLISTEIFNKTIEWNSGAKAAVGRQDDAWVVELKIPLASMRPAERQAILSGKPFGLQIGRENYSASAEAQTYLSTWSAAYAFHDPASFGQATFGGQATHETPVSWENSDRSDIHEIPAPQRVTYPFTRVFDFGPDNANPVDDPSLEITVITPESRYESGRTAGFMQDGDIQAMVAGDGGKRYYGQQLSPLAIDYVTSYQKNTFQFDLPPGDYEAVLVVGTDFRSSRTGGAPLRMTVSVQGREYVIENLAPARHFSKTRIALTAAQDQPVAINLIPDEGSRWALKYMVVYPVGDAVKARQAFHWIRRDEFNNPFEDVLAQAKLWIEYPPARGEQVTRQEMQAGFAWVNVPKADVIPDNYVPRQWDGRGGLAEITSPGQRTTLQTVFHAIKPFGRLHARIEQADAGLTVQPLHKAYKYYTIGKSSLKQYGKSGGLLVSSEEISLDARQSLPFYFVVDVSPDVKPGIHKATVAIYDGQRKVATRDIQLAVLPTKLTQDKLIRSVYFTSPTFSQASESTWQNMTPKEKALIVRDLDLQIQDLATHGVKYINTPGFAESYQHLGDNRYRYVPCERELALFESLRKHGVNEVSTFVSGYDAYSPGCFILNADLKKHGQPLVTGLQDRFKGAMISPEALDNLSELVRQNIAFRKQFGIKAPAFEIWDEPGHLNSEALVPFLKAIRKGGGRANSTVITASFPYLSDVTDLRTYAHLGEKGGEAESPGMIQSIRQARGVQYMVYLNAMLMHYDARIPRQFHAYFAWAWNLDGLTVWKYNKINGDLLLKPSFHPVLFDEQGHIVTTTANWEMFADGAYDSLLLQTLIEAVSRNESKAAREARAFIEKLRKDATFDLREIYHGFASLSGELVVDSSNWQPARFDYLRARLAEQLLEITGEGASHPQVSAVVKQIRQDAADRMIAQGRAMSSPSADGPAMPGVNLIANGGFENHDPVAPGKPGIQGFPRFSRDASIDAAVRHEGNQSLKFKRDDRKGIDVVVSSLIPLRPGSKYHLSAWARRGEASKDTITPATGLWALTYANEKAAQFTRRFIVRFPEKEPTFDWTLFEHEFVAQPGENWIDVRLFNNDTTSVIHLDDMKLVESPRASVRETLY